MLVGVYRPVEPVPRQETIALKQTRQEQLKLGQDNQQYVSVMIGAVFPRSGEMKLAATLLLATGGIANLFLALLFSLSIVH